MKPRSLMPFLLLAVGCSGSSSEPPASTASSGPPSTTMAAVPSPMGPTIEAEVVTMDAAAPSLTLREGPVPDGRTPTAKDLKPGDRTIRVEPSAAASLSALKAGMRVRVTCSAASATVTDAGPASPAMAGASPAMGTMASASPAMAGGAPPSMAGAAGGGMLTRCDSILSVTPLESAPAPAR